MTGDELRFPLDRSPLSEAAPDHRELILLVSCCGCDGLAPPQLTLPPLPPHVEEASVEVNPEPQVPFDVSFEPPPNAHSDVSQVDDSLGFSEEFDGGGGAPHPDELVVPKEEQICFSKNGKKKMEKMFQLSSRRTLTLKTSST